MSTIVIIPAYNEENNIGKVIQSIKNAGVMADIVVINDGSSDNTSELAKKAGAYVIDLPVNLGIGGAVQTGYLYAYASGYDIAIQVDGDGQHNGSDLTRIIYELEKNHADIAIGSRFVEESKYKASFFRKIGIHFFSKLVTTLIHYPVCDTTSGYRGVNKKAIELFSRYYPKDYPEVETIVYAYLMGLRIKEIPVNMNPRYSGKSSISLWKGLYYIVKVTIMLLLIPKKHILEQ